MTCRLVLLLGFSLGASAQEQDGFGLRFRELPELPGAIIAINDAGDLLLNAGQRSLRIAADGATTDLGSGTVGIAMNNRGQILLSRGAEMLLRQPDGTLEPRTFPGASTVRAFSLNNHGEIAGEAGREAILWDFSGRPRVLKTPFGILTGFNQQSAWGLNDHGVVIGGWPAGSGPYGVFRMTPDGFFARIGTSGRYPFTVAISNDGFGLLSYSTIYTLTSQLWDSNGSILYEAGTITITGSGFVPDRSVPVFRAISPNGRVVAGHRYGGPGFLAERCPATVSPVEADVEPKGGALRFAVTADHDCEWYAQGRRIRGNSEIEVDVTPSQAPIPTHVMIAGRKVAIRQGGGACEFSIPGTYLVAESSGAEFLIPITTAAGCPWAVTDVPPELIAVPASGTGPAEVKITVRPNRTTGPMRHWFRLAHAETFAAIFIAQDAVPCSFDITPLATLASGSGTAMLTVRTTCTWRATSDAAWIRINGDAIAYEANTSNQARTAELKIAGQLHRVTQQASAAGAPLLVEPSNGSGPRQSFRFTFAEPLTEARITIGTACAINYRIGFRPFSIEGSCQLNNASVTTAARQFRTVVLDLTIRERGPLAILADGRSLGIFTASDFAPAAPRVTQPTPVVPGTAAGALLIDSNWGVGGTFRLMLSSQGSAPIQKAELGFFRLDGPGVEFCRISLDVPSRRLTIIGNVPDVPRFIEIGRPETIEYGGCVVKGDPGSFTPLDAQGSRAVWDLTVFFRSEWSGPRGVSISMQPGTPIFHPPPGLGSGYTIVPAVLVPTVATSSGLIRIGFSAHSPISAARVRVGTCLFTYDSVLGLEAAPQPCTLDSARSSATVTGSDLVLVLAYSGGSSVPGGRAISAEATPFGGAGSGWFALGSLDPR